MTGLQILFTWNDGHFFKLLRSRPQHHRTLLVPDKKKSTLPKKDAPSIKRLIKLIIYEDFHQLSTPHGQNRFFVHQRYLVPFLFFDVFDDACTDGVHFFELEFVVLGFDMVSCLRGNESILDERSPALTLFEEQLCQNGTCFI